MMVCASTGSRLATGSSASINSGSCISARAMPTRCCWPPLSSSARLWALSAIPTRSKFCMARCYVFLGEAIDQTPGGIHVAQPAGQDVGQHAGASDQVELLEDHADPAPDLAQVLLRSGRHVHAVPDDPARGRLDQAVDAAQQGGLARAAQADDRQELSIGHLKAHIVERQHLVVVSLGQVLYAEQSRPSILL